MSCFEDGQSWLQMLSVQGTHQQPCLRCSLKRKLDVGFAPFSLYRKGNRHSFSKYDGNRSQFSRDIKNIPVNLSRSTDISIKISPTRIIIIRVYLQKLYCWKYSPHFLTLLPPCPALPTSTVQPSCVSEKIYIWINWLTEGCSGPDLISKHVLFNKSTVMCDVTVCYVTVQWRSSHVPASQCLENRGAPQRHLYSSNCSEILDIA